MGSGPWTRAWSKLSASLKNYQTSLALFRDAQDLPLGSTLSHHHFCRPPILPQPPFNLCPNVLLTQLRHVLHLPFSPFPARTSPE